MRQHVQHPRFADEATGQRTVLLPVVCTIRKPDTQEGKPAGRVLHLRRDVPQVQIGSGEERRRQALLLAGVLVLVQPTRQPLSLGGRSGRAHESRRADVAQGGRDTRPRALPHLPLDGSDRGAPHPLIHQTTRLPMGRDKRHHTLPLLSRSNPPAAGTASRGCRITQVHGYGSVGGVA